MNRLIIALDVDTEAKALCLVDSLGDKAGLFKIGLELFSSCGPGIVARIRSRGRGIFLDLKLHDIPTTVAKTAVSLTGLGVSMLNVHALGGFEMMEKAAKAVEAKAGELKIKRPQLLGVTILTSSTARSLKETGIEADVKKEVLRLACLAQDAGLDGVVASPEEVAAIRKRTGKDFLIVTPGVRPAWASADDQKRIATPAGAIASGADYIVVGRPVTAAEDPRAAAQKIIEEISAK